jgi:hypothetical protein
MCRDVSAPDAQMRQQGAAVGGVLSNRDGAGGVCAARVTAAMIDEELMPTRERGLGRSGRKILYGRPLLRGRQAFPGTGADYGKATYGPDATVWRAGANLTTRLRSEVPLVIGGTTAAPLAPTTSASGVRALRASAPGRRTGRGPR